MVEDVSVKTRAVLFDVDGVLVDSYQAHYQGWLRAGRDWGYSITEADFAKTFGRTSREVIVDTFKMTWLTDAQIRQLDTEKEAHYRDIVADDFPAMDGVTELLDSLAAAGFRLAVGSSGPPPNVDIVLEKLQRRALFGKIITGADVVRGKPDPQVFLLGANGLGVPAENCVVIEDAPAGIAAAHNAGMKAVGFASTGRTAAELQEADLLIHSLSELTPQRLRDLIDGL